MCLSALKQLLSCREQQGPTIDDALDSLKELGPEDPTGSQEAGMSARGLIAKGTVKARSVTV